MRPGYIFILLCLVSLTVNGQSNRRSKKFRLPPALREISGLVVLGDTLLAAINDGGNSPEIYFLTLNGSLVKRTTVLGSQNIDWEDLACDTMGNLFIADVGNNLNNRTDLHILKISISDALWRDSVAAARIDFSYPDQGAFPPQESDCRFNCEAIYWFNDSLFLITKNEAKIRFKRGWDRSPRVYSVSDQPGTQRAHLRSENPLKGFRFNRKGISELVTGVDFKNGRLVLLTYFKLLSFSAWNSENQTLNVRSFFRVLQREAIALSENGWVYIGAEHHRLLGGPFLIKKRINAN